MQVTSAKFHTRMPHTHFLVQKRNKWDVYQSQLVLCLPVCVCMCMNSDLCHEFLSVGVLLKNVRLQPLCVNMHTLLSSDTAIVRVCMCACVSCVPLLSVAPFSL